MGEVYSADQVIKVLRKKGFSIHHQKGSHIALKRDIPKGRVTVPNHHELAKGTFFNILEQAGLSLQEFKDLLK